MHFVSKGGASFNPGPGPLAHAQCTSRALHFACHLAIKHRTCIWFQSTVTCDGRCGWDVGRARQATAAVAPVELGTGTISSNRLQHVHVTATAAVTGAASAANTHNSQRATLNTFTRRCRAQQKGSELGRQPRDHFRRHPLRSLHSRAPTCSPWRVGPRAPCCVDLRVHIMTRRAPRDACISEPAGAS